MLRSLITAGLERFTAWAVARGGVHATDPNSTDKDPLRGYTIADLSTGEPYITRVLLPRIPWLNMRPMLHHIHRADHERDLHNHPWTFAFSIVLRGSYDEERLCNHEHGCEKVTSRTVRWFNFIRGGDFHRITRLHGDVWTLFVTGPRTQSWGFREWDTGYQRWDTTPNEEYIARKKAERLDDEWPGELSEARGASLDCLARNLGIERFNNPVDGFEPDSALRIRLIRAIGGE